MTNESIGILAGEIWKYLSEHGETDEIHLKLALNTSNTLLFLALGWLAREEKVAINRDKNSCRVKLKE